jgi:hypothetical protein
MLVREYPMIVTASNKDYRVHICGLQRADGTWEGWLEFHPQGRGLSRCTGQETSQPNLAALEYWADGLEPVYIEGAFERTKTFRTKNPKLEKAA